MEIEFKAWAAFVFSAKHGSISKAAIEMKLSHSTLSRQIAALEDDLGYCLFNRSGTGKKLTITAEGSRVLPKAELVLKTLGSLNEQAIQLFDKESPTSLNIAISDIIPQSAVSELASSLWKRWPFLEVQFSRPSLFESYRLCINQHVDFAVVIREPQPLQELQTETISQIDMAFCVNKTHPLAGRGSLSIEDLIPYRFFYPIKGNSGLSLAESDQFSLNISYTQQFEQAKLLALAGLGVAPLPLHMVSKYIECGELVSLPVYDAPLSMNLMLELVYLKSYPYADVKSLVLEALLNST